MNELKNNNVKNVSNEIGNKTLLDLPVSYRYLDTSNYTVKNAKLCSCSYYDDVGFYSILFYKPISKFKIK
ncbi:MAG: hypothetical protein B6D64_10485 [Bacteroidetes bacterium 4484_276]|nr:MAG: hypothetical protein B6D64_10485 [Bacteroidetes bacterium 4484_276]